MITEAIAIKSDNEERTNGWEALLPLLDLRVSRVLTQSSLWQQLDPILVKWLIKTVSTFPWFNHLALLSVIYTQAGVADVAHPIQDLHTFLRRMIPDHFTEVAALEPERALILEYGDPPRARGISSHRAYSTLQLHSHRYLKALLAEEQAILQPFVLPPLVITVRLQKLRARAMSASRAARKQQAFAVVHQLPGLMALGKRRYQWITELDSQVQQVIISVNQGEMALPATVQLKAVDQPDELVFRIWDRLSWVEAHQNAYKCQALSPARSLRANGPLTSQHVFLQFVGNIPPSVWFLRAWEVNLFSGQGARAPAAKAYAQLWNIPLARVFLPGVLTPVASVELFLRHARRVVRNTPEDSGILFAPDPLLPAAAIGFFVLVSLASTGMRLGELMQVALDRECMEAGAWPQFDDRHHSWIAGPRQLYWRLYPKGGQKRERYLVAPEMIQAMLRLLDLHKRFHNGEGFQLVRPQPTGFSHRRRFHGKHKFILQWSGRHLPMQILHQCLNFLLLEHPCRDPAGRPTRITPHVLRHGVAGWLRQQGISLEEIMGLLKQVNLAVTDYYSQLSPDDLYQKIGPALTALADLADIDPATVRTVGDIQALASQALKRYGVLRQTPGGTCSVFTPCEVQFKCAGCPAYLPDPARRPEVQEKISSHSKAIQLFSELGDYLQADLHRAHLWDWRRVEKEMEVLAEIELVSPPLNEFWQQIVADELEPGTSQSLELLSRVLPPGGETHA